MQAHTRLPGNITSMQTVTTHSWPQHLWKLWPQRAQVSTACTHQVGPPAELQRCLHRCLPPWALQGWLASWSLHHCCLQLPAVLPQRLHGAGCLQNEPAACAAALPPAGHKVSCE